MTDRARPGLVALYDIRPGNGAGQFLQPRSPHGAINPSVGCHYFQPGPRLPPQPPSITAHWPVPNYTAWWQRRVCLNNRPTIALHA